MTLAALRATKLQLHILLVGILKLKKRMVARTSELGDLRKSAVLVTQRSMFFPMHTSMCTVLEVPSIGR